VPASAQETSCRIVVPSGQTANGRSRLSRRSVCAASGIDVDIVRQHSPYSSTGLVWASAATSTGLPAAVVPIDRGDSLLTIGLQVIGPYLEDRTVRAFAAQLERKFGGFVPPPGYA
jgi:Asp-tRNA(Asn)/Glu-tRNA(Gln) amidotransferase A subunit family amidase